MANNLFVSYDLMSPGQKYDRVIAAIKNLGDWAKVLESTWYVDTSLTSAQAADAVHAAMDSNDKLFVVDATNNSSAWRGPVPQNVSEFIKNHWNT